MAKHDTLFIGIELPQKLKARIIVFCMAGLKIIGDSTHLVLACCLKSSGRGKALVGILEETLPKAQLIWVSFVLLSHLNLTL